MSVKGERSRDVAEARVGPPVSRLIHLVAPLVVVVGFLFVTLTFTRHGISDPDTFWHLRAGEELSRSWGLVRDHTGSAFSTNPWVLHEWLPELAMGLALRVAGLAGVAWLWQAAVVGITVALVMLCRRRAGLLPAAFAALLGIAGTISSLSPRPQLVTFLLVIVTVGAWLSTAEDSRPRWWLVPLTLVWACSHGMWFLGPVIGGVVILGMLIDAVTAGGPGRPEIRACLRLSLVPVLSVVAAGITPIGPALLLVPLQVSGYTQFVSEWGPSPLSSIPYAATLAALAATAVLWARSGRRVPAARVALWALALLAVVAYARTVAVAAILVAPLFAEAFDRLLHHVRYAPDGDERRTMRTERRVILVAAAATLVIAVGTVGGEVVEEPTGLDRQISGLPAGTVVYNSYEDGGWFLWAHPNLSPVIDGRTEIFTVAYVRAYAEAAQAQPGWQQTVADSGARYAVLSTTSPLADGLVHQLHWTVAAKTEDDQFLVAPGTVTPR